MTNTTESLAEVSHADELAWANLEIQKAQRQITRGMSELAEGIVSLSLALLDVRRRRLYRFDATYTTFEAFVEQRHGISAPTAHQYTEALASLGEAQYRALIADLGVQRTYALAMLQKADPALLTAFQALPDNERHAVTVAQIEAVDDAATAALRAKVAQLEQEVTRERGLHQQSRKRLQEAEELHQRVSSDLIDERDAARQALDDEQEQTERLRAMLAEAKRQLTAPPLPQAPTVPPRLMLPLAQTDVSDTSVAIVLNAHNIRDLANEASRLTTKLAQLAAIDYEEVPPEERRSLATALQRLQNAVDEVLNGA